MTYPPTSPAERHPLEDDRERLERIVDVMWAQIHKVLHYHAPPRRRTGSGAARVIGEPISERLIRGGESTEDILSDCLIALLGMSPEKVVTSWEAVAVGIAKNKTKGALRAGEAGLRATDRRPKLTVISGDRPGPPNPDGGPRPTVLEDLEAQGPDLEAEFYSTAQQIEVLKLACELLDERDRTIFLGLHTDTRTRMSLADEFGLSPPGVRDVYRRAARTIYNHPRFQRYAEGGTHGTPN